MPCPIWRISSTSRSIDSSLVPTFLVNRLVRQHCTVALGGDGGDDLRRLCELSQLVRMQASAGRVPVAVRQFVAAAALQVLPVGMPGAGSLQWLGLDFRTDLPRTPQVFDVAARRRLLAGHPSWRPVAEAWQRRQVPADTDVVQRATRMDFLDYLPEDILVKVDRASMLSSVEVRAPLLDRRIIEFAFGRVPSVLKATATDKKILLKRLTERLLPPDFDRHRKQGFSVPMSQWLSGGPFRALFHDVLLARNQIFDRRTVEGLLRGQDRGRANGERLFGLVMFELWRRDYRVTL